MKIFEKGFTLLELIITLVIVTILVSVGVPSFSNMLSANRVVGAAEKMKADMEWARTTAIKDNKNITMTTITVGGDWCYGFDDGMAACDCNVNNSCTVGGVTKQYVDTPYGNTTLGPVGNYSLTFTARGVLTAAAPGVLTFGLDGRAANVSITRLGRSSICSDNLGQFPGC